MGTIVTQQWFTSYPIEQLHPIAVGIDVGQVHDPTAISVAEVTQVHTGKYRQCEPIPAHLGPGGEWIPPKDADPVFTTIYTIRHIRRLPLGLSYPAVAEHIASMLCNLIFARRQVRVLIDVTGVGRPVYDDLRREISLRPETANVWLKPISFVHGEKYNKTTGALGKAYLVSRLQSLLQSGRVHGPDTPEMQATVEELKVYEIKIDQDGKDSYGAETGKHDDLATALGLSCLEDPWADRAKVVSRRVY